MGGLKTEDYRVLADFRAALREFLQFSEGQAASAGLSPRQHQVLLLIRARDSAPTIGEVGAALGLKPHSASELVRRMVQVGLLRLESDPDDLRRSRLLLTGQAERALATLSTVHRDELRRMRPALTRLLDQLD